MKNTKFFIWNGETIMADVYQNLNLPTGDEYCYIGGFEIKKGDIIEISHGRNFNVVTENGKGYESEHPFGKIFLLNTEIQITLDSENRKNVVEVTESNKIYEKKLKEQNSRANKSIKELKCIFWECLYDKYVKENNTKFANQVNKKVKFDKFVVKMTNAISNSLRKKTISV